MNEQPKTEIVEQPPQGDGERQITYKPAGGTGEIKLTVGVVRRYLTQPTKTGKQPTDEDVVRYMMLCLARELDPWQGDCYLTGYDTKNGPTFSLITSVYAFWKRAEMCPEFDGVESGVIVTNEEGTESTRQGSIVRQGEKIVGGWAKCHRKDRKVPYHSEVSFSVYNTGRSRWAVDPAGMIVKVAEAEALRKSFPAQLQGMYTGEEMDHTEASPAPRQRTSRAGEKLREE